MKRWTTLRTLLDYGARYLLAAVFLVAGVPKMANPPEFAAIIEAYGLLPEPLVLPAAVLLPLAEIVGAIALIFNRTSGIWLITLLMACFILVLGYAISVGLDIDCGCFGPEDPEREAFSGLRTALIRDLLLCLPLGYSMWYHYTYRKKKEIGR